MQNKFLLGAIVIGSLAAGLQSCKKEASKPENPATTPASSPAATSDPNASARMWFTGKTLFGVGLRQQVFTATLYKISPPPISGLMPGVISPLFIGGGVQLTYATGVAFLSTDIVVSTGPLSNVPNSLLIYPAAGPFTSPTSVVSCPGITDVEFNEYDNKLYGIFNNAQIVSISSGGAITVNYTPVLGPGQRVKEIGRASCRERV